MPYMAQVLTKRIKNDPRINLQKHWKVRNDVWICLIIQIVNFLCLGIFLFEREINLYYVFHNFLILASNFIVINCIRFAFVYQLSLYLSIIVSEDSVWLIIV